MAAIKPYVLTENKEEGGKQHNMKQVGMNG
jgi:hypothetical protein